MLSIFLTKAIVLLLPTQLGFHFWPSFSRVAGIKIDYLSPTLYLTDIFIILLIILNLKVIQVFLRRNVKKIAIYFLFIAINIYFAISPLNTLFWWLRTNLYLLCFLTFVQNKIRWSDVKTPLLISTITIVAIEISQLLQQSSLGGIFYFLGERDYSSITPGIGRLNLLGNEILRPISTFSHSNSLAGYLLIVYLLFSKKSNKAWYKLIPFLGIILTFSKSSIVGLSLIIFNVSPGIIIATSIVLTAIQPLLQNYSIYFQSVSDRQFFYKYLKQICLLNPITGVGLGSFIPSMGNYLPGSFLSNSKLQPIHNTFYLAIAELGITGTILTVWYFSKNLLNTIQKNHELFTLVSIVIYSGIFDHFIWTLPQNKLILVLALAIMV